MTNADLVQTYVDLLIIEYADPNNQPRALATIALIAGEAIANQVVGQVGAAYSITTAYGQSVAQGDQLDVLGQFVGAQRVLPGYAPALTFFGQQDAGGSYSASIGGYGDVSTGTPPTDYWNSVSSSAGSYTLSDAQLIQLIRYLAAANNAYLSVAAVDAILFAAFGSFVTLSEGDMTATYTQSPSDPGTLFGIVEFLGKFPHPAGVEVLTSP